jgi:Tol biopolymer transport system component
VPAPRDWSNAPEPAAGTGTGTGAGRDRAHADELVPDTTETVPGPAPAWALASRIAEATGGRYEVLGAVGEGGMGSVCRARDLHLNRIVAIKAIRLSLASDPAASKRLAREARLAASLDHPFICEIHELLQPPDGPTLVVMEYVDGATLRTTLDKGPMTPAVVVRVAREIAEAMGVAHGQGMVHRDIKPSNVMLTTHGHIKVMDFGIAKAAVSPDASTTSALTGSGRVIGTPEYMSPEQAAGRAVDHRSDIYSFGVLLFECLTGELPYDPAPRSVLLRWLPRARKGTYPRRVPSELRVLVSRCLEVRPDDRFQSFAEISAALEAPSLSRLTSISTRVLVPVQTWTWRSWAWLTLLAVAVVGGALLVERWWTGQGARTGLRVQRPIVSWPTVRQGSRVSPDGTAVAFLSNQRGQLRLWVESVDGREPAPVAGPRDAMKSPVWSPDGRRLAFMVRDGGQAWVQIATVWGELDGPPRPLGGAWDDVALVRWLGSRLYFSVSSGSSASVLWVFDTGAGTRRQVTDAAAGMRFTTSGGTIDVDVRRDERRIVFVSANSGNSLLWVADLDGRNAAQVPVGGGLVATPRWRDAAGAHIVFVSNANGQSDVWDYDLVARRRSPITTSPLEEDSIDVSATGDVIVADTVEQVSHLWAVRPETSEAPVQLTNDRSDIWPSVAAASGRVAFHRRRGSFVESTPIDTDVVTARWAAGRLNEETTVGAGASGRISADGRRVYFLRRQTGGPAEREKPPELWVQDLDALRPAVRVSATFWFPGNHIATWAATGQTAAWGPGSDSLFFVRPESGAGSRYELVEATLDAALQATTRVLATTAADAPDDRISDIIVSDAGEAVVYVTTGRRPYRGGRLMRLALRRPTGSPQLLFEAAPTTQFTVAGTTRRGDILALASSRPDRGGLTELFEIDATGRRPPRRLASYAGLLSLTAQADPFHDRLFATEVEGGAASVCAISLQDGKKATVVSNALAGITFAGYTPMPDGWLLYMRKETNVNVWLFDFRTASAPRASEGGR